MAQRARERREQAIAEGKEPEPLPNPFKITLNGGDINPEKGVAMEFEMPLSSVDQTALKLTTGDSTNIQEFPVSMVRDSVDVRKWRLEAPWLPAMRYRLLILPGALRDVAGNQNDSITRTFQVPEIDRVGTINIEVVGKTPESEYVVQLTDEGGIRVIDEKRHVKTGTISFGYLSPGKVRVKVIEDVSGNGEWNTGNLVNRSQPERVELWALKEEEPTITVRAGWIEDVKIDMAELFAPITTQSLWQRLEREDAARLEKLMEEVTRRREERARQERQGQRQSAGSMMQGATGLSLPGL